MKIFSHPLVLIAAMAVRLTAQQVGDTEKSVRAAIGAPSIIQDAGDRQIWVYPHGGKIVFERGMVLESSGDCTPTRSEEDRPSTTEVVKQTLRESLPAPLIETKQALTRPTQIGGEIRKFKGLGQNNGYALLFGGIGVLITLVCCVTILIEAFCESVIWGIAVVILPIAQTLFVATHWRETKKPFLTMLLLGLPLIFVGFRT